VDHGRRPALVLHHSRLIVLDTTRKQGNPPPQVAIEDPLVNGQIQEPSSIGSLPPGQKNISFHYTGLSFLAPAQITFRYKLDGYDKDWINAGDRREAFYTNLPPGKYRFQVMGLLSPMENATSNIALWISISRITTTSGFGFIRCWRCWLQQRRGFGTGSVYPGPQQI